MERRWLGASTLLLRCALFVVLYDGDGALFFAHSRAKELLRVAFARAGRDPGEGNGWARKRRKRRANRRLSNDAGRFPDPPFVFVVPIRNDPVGACSRPLAAQRLATSLLTRTSPEPTENANINELYPQRARRSSQRCSRRRKGESRV